MAKKELTVNEHNDAIWAKIKKLEGDISSLKDDLKPAVLPKQASLNECNALARKANVKPVKVDPKKVAEESGVSIAREVK